MSQGTDLSTDLVQDLFVAQASRTPDRPAVIADGRTLTYRELLSLSRAWGRKLRNLGAKPNTLVAVVMQKGWEQIAAVLSILESGAAYLPIDTNVPQARLEYLLENSGATLVLTQSAIAPRFNWPAHVTRFSIDTENPGEDSTPLARAQTPDDLAYVLYTSGSTGTPKGVMIAHRGLVNCIVETNATFHVTANDRALALTALHHDMSLFDIFGLLASGGAIVMPDPNSARSPDRWVDLIDKQRVTIWNSVPAFMEMLLEYANSQQLRLRDRLRLAFLGGDWIPMTAHGRIQAHFGDVQVVSVGGPTETTVWNIWYPIQKMDASWKSVPYGHAIANTTYYVLDESLQDCPAGTPGELCAAGVGVMKGYWRDEERTKLKLAIHPRTGERICRTGDRGRFREDGEIEFLGRLDTQVKIFGQRIELGEIESTLSACPGVKKAIVSAVQVGDQKRLAAYLVPENGQIPAAAQLRVFIESRLPCYMTPAAFVQMNSLPLNSNGKVDRNALPVPEHWSEDNLDAIRSACAVEPQQTNQDVGETIATVWRTVLRINRVNPDDNFFDLGGNSVLLIQAHSELQRRLNRTLAVTQLFEFPTLRSLRAHLEGQAPDRTAMSDAEMRAKRQREAMAQRRMARSL